MFQVSIQTNTPGGVVNEKLHSQFIEFLGTCISGGIWVGEDSDIPNIDGLRKDIVDALAALQPPVIRWPGGCYADNYHWRWGVGPKEERPATFNTNFGTQAIEDNHFGTHEFMRFCRLVGAEPWINVNIMSGSVSEMQEWADYMNRPSGTTLSQERADNGDAEPFRVKYWGIGNETWGGGGSYTAQGYEDEYRKYATALTSRLSAYPPNPEIPKPFLIAVGPDGNKPVERVRWTRDFFEQYAKYRQPALDGYDLHFYNWNITHEDTATQFDSEAWYRVLNGCLELEEVIHEQHALIKEGLSKIPESEGPFKFRGERDVQLIVGEWGNWHRMEPNAPSALFQQCTMRDALTTALTLDIFHRNCALVDMACTAQTVNVLNSLFLTYDDVTVLTPNYHVFNLYKVHRGAQAVLATAEGPSAREGLDGVYSFASIKDGQLNVNLINPSYDAPCRVALNIDREAIFESAQCLGGIAPDACNTAESPDAVVPRAADAPSFDGEHWIIDLPKASVSVYRFRLPE